VRWNFIERAVLKLCEYFVVTMSEKVCCIATWEKHYVKQKYNKAVVCTYNSLFLRARVLTKNYLKKFLFGQYKYF